MSNHNPPTNGFDKRKHQINRLGRPKSIDDVRALAQAIAHEEAIKDKEPIIINGHKATAAEIVLRQWLTSGNFQKQLAFMQYAFGKIPDDVKVDLSFDRMTDAELFAFISEQFEKFSKGTE